MVFAACALIAIAVSGPSQETPASLAMKRAARVGEHFQALQEGGNATMPAVDGEPEAGSAGMPKINFSIDKIRFPTTWEAFRETFGIHLWWSLFVLCCAGLTWGYINYIRPRVSKEEVEGDEALLDENDVTANLVRMPYRPPTTTSLNMDEWFVRDLVLREVLSSLDIGVLGGRLCVVVTCQGAGWSHVCVTLACSGLVVLISQRTHTPMMIVALEDHA